MRAERGSATVEFVLLGLSLVLPLVVAVTALAHLHGARTELDAVTGRVALSVARGDVSPLAARRLVLIGVDPEVAAVGAVHVDCRPRPCPSRGGVVIVSAEARVNIPGLPDVVRLTSQHAEAVDRFGGGGS